MMISTAEIGMIAMGAILGFIFAMILVALWHVETDEEYE